MKNRVNFYVDIFMQIAYLALRITNYGKKSRKFNIDILEGWLLICVAYRLKVSEFFFYVCDE